MREASGAPSRIYHYSHIPSSTAKPVAIYSHKRERESSRDPKSLQESHCEREKGFAEHREIHDFLELRPDHAAQGEQAALSKLSEAEYHTRLHLEEQKKNIYIYIHIYRVFRLLGWFLSSY